MPFIRFLFLPIMFPLHVIVGTIVIFFSYLFNGFWWFLLSVAGLVSGVSLILIPVIAAFIFIREIGDYLQGYYTLGTWADEFGWSAPRSAPKKSYNTSAPSRPTGGTTCSCGGHADFVAKVWVKSDRSDGTVQKKPYDRFKCRKCGRNLDFP